MKGSSSFTFILVIIFSLLLLLRASFADSDVVQRSCKQAAKRDPYVDYKLCVKSLRADPQSKSATFKELVVISIKQAISNATDVSSKISDLLKGSKWENYSVSCLQACSELYSDAISDLKQALSALKAKDHDRANTEVSSAMDAPITCEDGYNEKEGEVSPLSEKNNLFFQLTAISLAFINMCH